MESFLSGRLHVCHVPISWGHHATAREGTIINVSFEADGDPEKVKIFATVDETKRALDPFAQSISEPNAIEKLVGKWFGQVGCVCSMELDCLTLSD